MTRAGRDRSRLGWWLLVLGTLVAYAPLLGVLATGALAGALGCTVDEAGVHPCPLPGGWGDVGELLDALLVLGWLMLVTALPMLALPVVWVRLGVRAWRRRAAGQRAP